MFGGAWRVCACCDVHREQIQARDDTMRIGIVMLIVLALWPWRAGAQEATIMLASADPGTVCLLEAELPWYHPRRAGQAACAWTADLRSAVSTVRNDWGYQAGATLFVVGNAVTFSFPLWAALGADVYTVTGVIIAGEAIEVVGIYMLGEEAFHDLKGTLRDMANQLGDQMNQLGDQINRLKASAPVWS
jgi:hypothetical protein